MPTVKHLVIAGRELELSEKRSKCYAVLIQLDEGLTAKFPGCQSPKTVSSTPSAAGVPARDMQLPLCLGRCEFRILLAAVLCGVFHRQLAMPSKVKRSNRAKKSAAQEDSSGSYLPLDVIDRITAQSGLTGREQIILHNLDKHLRETSQTRALLTSALQVRRTWIPPVDRGS